MQRYSNKNFRWYEQDREVNNPDVFKSHKKLLSPEWNKNRPVETQMYQSTLENQAKCQQYLIDRIIQRLDEIEKQMPNDFTYDNYLYSSPSHQNVLCTRIPRFTHKNKSSLTVPKSKAVSSVHEQVKHKSKLNHPARITHESIDHLLRTIQPTKHSESKITDTASFQLKSPALSMNKDELSFKTIELYSSDSESRKSIKILNVPKIPPVPPSLIKSPIYSDNNQSELSKSYLETIVEGVPTPKAPPPAPPLPPCPKIDLKATSGDETDNSKLPNNFLSELVERKKKLKHNEPVLDNDDKKTDQFIQELKERIHVYQEDSERAKKIEEKIKKNVENNEKKMEEEIKFSTINQETQTDALSRQSSKSNRSWIESPKSSSNENRKQTGFKIVSVDNQEQVSAKKEHKKSDSTISYRNTSSESSSTDEDKKINNELINESKLIDSTSFLDDSQNIDHFETPMSTIHSSRTQSQRSTIGKTSSESETIKMENEDFILNIFSQSFQQNNDSTLPLVYNCKPLEKDARLKNVLIKLYFDLEKYNAQTNNKELDILVRNADDCQTHFGNSSLASFRRTNSHPGNLVESASNNTIASREAFFESLRQLVEESQDETDNEYQRSFQNLNDFYNSLLKKFQSKFQSRNDSFDVISSGASEGEIDFLNNQLSDGSAMHSDLNDYSDLNNLNDKFLPNEARSSFIAVIDEASEQSSSDTVFKPSKKTDSVAYEVDERSVSRNSKDFRSREQIKMSTDSDDVFTKPNERKTPTKYFKRKQNSTDINKVYVEEERKFRTNSSLDARKEIWDSEIERAKSVTPEKMNKQERERPKSVAFVDYIQDEPKSDVTNLIKIWSQAKKASEDRSKNITNREEREIELKKLEELKKNVERSSLFIIWKEASNASKQRSKMRAYEQVSKEQHAFKLNKMLVQDLDKNSDESIDEKLSAKNVPLPPVPTKKSSSSTLSSTSEQALVKNSIPIPPPLPQWNQPSDQNNDSINVKKSDKIIPIVPLKENKNETKSKRSSIPVLAGKLNLKKKSDSSQTSEEYIDVRLTPPLPESNYPTIDKLIRKFEYNKATVSTSNSEKSNNVPLRTGGIISNKEVNTRNEEKNNLEESRKSFSQLASNLLQNAKKSNSFKIESDTLPDNNNFDKSNETEENNENSKMKHSEINVQKTESISGAGINLSDETSDASSDIGKYFILKPKIPPKFSPGQTERAHKIEPESYDSESSSSDYAIPRNVSLFNLEKKESSKELIPSFLTQEKEKVRNSSLLDKILLNQSNIDQQNNKNTNEENFNKENLDENKIIEDKKTNLETDSLQSEYNSEEEENFVNSNEQPSAETLEIIRRLRDIPSQSASPEMYGLRKIDSELTRETKLSGGKQRKPNEESFDRSFKRTKSSNSMNSNLRSNFFNKLFGRDKDSSSSLKKKKKFS